MSETPHAYLSAIGRRGGLRGGKIAAERMTAAQRSQRASLAARARWGTPEDVPMLPRHAVRPDFLVGDTVEITDEAYIYNRGIRSRTGVVVGLGRNGNTIWVRLRGNRSAMAWAKQSWRVVVPSVVPR